MADLERLLKHSMKTISVLTDKCREHEAYIKKLIEAIDNEEKARMRLPHKCHIDCVNRCEPGEQHQEAYHQLLDIKWRGYE